MIKAKLTFLGTGTSQGIPIIGCRCPVCQSPDPRDKRFRAAALVEFGGLRILIDAGPDFRMQMLAHGIGHLDAILLTHNHKDHTGGLDDVRSLNYIDRRAVDIFCEDRVLTTLKREYGYAFEEHRYPGSPEWHVHIIDERPFIVRSSRDAGELVWVHDVGYFLKQADGSLAPSDATPREAEHPVPGTGQSTDRFAADDAGRGTVFPTPPASGPLPSAWVHVCENSTRSGASAVVLPIRGYHDQMPVLGFRFGNIAYITDMSRIPEEEFAKLEGLDHVSLNTVGYKTHHSHFSLDEALAIADRIGAKHTWLTHLSHTFPVHERFAETLRALCRERGIRSDVQPAYDGLTVE